MNKMLDGEDVLNAITFVVEIVVAEQDVKKEDVQEDFQNNNCCLRA